MKNWILIVALLAATIATAFVVYWKQPQQILHRECKAEFETTLKSPATMVIVERLYDGPLDPDPAIKPNDRMRYAIDSQNSYGALIRSSYACERFGSIVRLREVDATEWTLIPLRRSPKVDQNACVALAAKDLSMPLPEAQNIKFHNDGALTFDVSSPEWGSASFRCTVNPFTSVMSVQMGLRD